MSAESIIGRLLIELSVLLAGLINNAADLPHMQVQAQTIQQIRDNLSTLNDRQEAAKASLHQLTEQIKGARTQSRFEMRKARNGVKAVYGDRTQKLEEFGIPVRSAARAKPRKPAQPVTLEVVETPQG